MRTRAGWFAVCAIAVLLLLPIASMGAVPQTMNYQGYLTDAAGVPVNETRSIVFSLYSADTGGTPLWTETHPNVTVTKGVYSVVLGNGSPAVPIALSFNAQYYLGVTVGTDSEMTPRQALTVAPYSFRAADADKLGGQTASSYATLTHNHGSLYVKSYDTGMISMQGAYYLTGTLGINGTLNSGTVSANTSNTNNLTVYPDGILPAAVFQGDDTPRVEILPSTPGTGIYVYSPGPGYAGDFQGNVNVSGSLTAGSFTGNGAGLTNIPLAAHTHTGSEVTTAVANATNATNAANATNADTVDNQHASDFAASGHNHSSSYVQKTGDSMSGILNISGDVDDDILMVSNATGTGAIFSITDPANSQQAVRIMHQGTGTGLYVETNGPSPAGDFRGNVNVSGSVTADSFTGNGAGLSNVTPAAHSHAGGDVTTAVASATNAVNADTLDNQHASEFAASGHTHNSAYVQKTGDNMSGPLILPTDGLVVGSNQLVLSGGKLGIGAAPSSAGRLQVVNSDAADQAGYFTNNNAANNLPAVYANTLGAGQAIYGLNQGTGRAGEFQIFNADSMASALYAKTNGTGYAVDIDGKARVTGALEAGSITTTSGNTNFAITSGNVGIGTANPTEKLEVAGTVKATALTATGNANFAVTSGNVGIGTSTPSEKLDVAGTVKATAMITTGNANFATTSGKVGIGTSNPTEKLDVEGTIKATTFSGSGSAISNVNAATLNGQSSSEIIAAASDEVRTPISACGVTINTPGSYYVTQNLTTTGGTCITVSMENVTLDLMGFALYGQLGTSVGIYISSGPNVEIRNGMIANFNKAIDTAAASGTIHSHRVLDVRVKSSNHGIQLKGENNLVKGCTVAYSAMGTGIYLPNANGSIIANNIVHNNAGYGIVANGDSSIVNNSAYKNGAGISATGGSVENNIVSYNDGIGIQIDGGSAVRNVVKYNNQANAPAAGGIVTTGASQVINNMVQNNLYNNIVVASSGNVLEYNFVSGSAIGITFNAEDNFYDHNRATGNTSANYEENGHPQQWGTLDNRGF